MVLADEPGVEERVEEVVGDLRRQRPGAGDVDGDGADRRIDGLAVEHAVRCRVDHAGRRGGFAPGKFRVDDDAQEAPVELADEPVDVRLIGALRAEPGELAEGERLGEDVDVGAVLVGKLGGSVRQAVVGVIAHQRPWPRSPPRPPDLAGPKRT